MKTHQKTKRRHQQRSPDERNELIELYKGSGQKVSEFCQEHDIRVTTFYGWLSRAGKMTKRKKSRKSDKYCFVEAAVTGTQKTTSEASAGVEIVLRTGTVIRIRDAASAAHLGTWLKEVMSC